MHNPKEYRHIKAWGHLMGSFQYYIEDQQALAALENAPLNAIYKDHDDGRWVTYDAVEIKDTRNIVDSFLITDASQT